MYRNCDGRGSAFGDVAVGLRSRSPGALAVYAAQRTSDGALSVIVINKTRAAIVHGPNVTRTATGWSATYPANSITLLVIPKKR